MTHRLDVLPGNAGMAFVQAVEKIWCRLADDLDGIDHRIERAKVRCEALERVSLHISPDAADAV